MSDYLDVVCSNTAFLNSPHPSFHDCLPCEALSLRKKENAP